MTQNLKKQKAATEALKYVQEGAIIGVGTGSTVNFFIDGLASMKDKIKLQDLPIKLYFISE